ncbi:MAG: BrnA antitoxin family protein [Alphaproteobacteria bacterium]|nr:BrnA antitoxin family protein [Alphaproteobacteria bacterium]
MPDKPAPKPKKQTKELVSIRLSRDVLAHLRASGEGWQTRLDEALRLLIEKKP